jgi:hypothetical protein
VLTTPNGDASANTGPTRASSLSSRRRAARRRACTCGPIASPGAGRASRTSTTPRARPRSGPRSRAEAIARKIAEGSGDATLGDPAWSGDGRLACAVGRAGAIVSAGAKLRLQLPFVEIASLGWSPDGTRFVVVGLTKDSAADDVYTVRTDGTGLRRLTHDVEAYWASWR